MPVADRDRELVEFLTLLAFFRSQYQVVIASDYHTQTRLLRRLKDLRESITIQFLVRLLRHAIEKYKE